MVRGYTTIEQSKKLAEILPIESADMYWDLLSKSDYAKVNNIGCCLGRTCVYAWSLAVLLNVLPNTKLCHYDDGYFCQYMNRGDEFPTYSTNEYNNPVDACVAMIEKLHELNLI